MFTVEYEYEEFVVTVVDDTATHEDVTIIINDNITYIRQFDTKTGRYDLIKKTPLMLEEIKQSFRKSEGAYYIVNTNKGIQR